MMGTPVSGRVAYFCALDRNEGFCPSILSCFTMGSPYGLSVVFLPLDRNEVFGYLVCIPSGWGHPVSGLNLTFWSQVKELLQLGSWERFSGPSSGWVFVILWSAGRLWSGEGSTFSCLRFWRGLCGYPSSQGRSWSWPFFFFWPCCLSPSPGGSVCFGGLFYTWCLSRDSPVLLGSPWRLPPRLVSLGGPLLGPPAISSWLHGVGVVRRAHSISWPSMA